ncbi:hypothetical protein EDEG_00983 [Edhazardia aedis USNM 41457]|uniref:Transmembrane protein n=1 Tax=Edhazardia aedis (strain USNM 41457) TaxID=1003232 RepID=J8ZYQ9_EDHAE|nr:hypothetical protein EDEG_00983 [Edhazardia aedis USNM 41457]|eukprot:EJW04813.1 hypothetical protein EDEG_00983 [Edhazardia aedis USNM 41457]
MSVKEQFEIINLISCFFLHLIWDLDKIFSIGCIIFYFKFTIFLYIQILVYLQYFSAKTKFNEIIYLVEILGKKYVCVNVVIKMRNLLKFLKMLQNIHSSIPTGQSACSK